LKRSHVAIPHSGGFGWARGISLVVAVSQLGAARWSAAAIPLRADGDRHLWPDLPPRRAGWASPHPDWFSCNEEALKASFAKVLWVFLVSSSPSRLKSISRTSLCLALPREASFRAAAPASKFRAPPPPKQGSKLVPT
jgi:hypothetical protein